MTVELSLFDPAKTYQGMKQFDCGHAVINKFVAGSLKQQVRNGLSVAYVLTDSANNDHFVGFYTIAQHTIANTSLSAVEKKSLPHTVPCTRLIMLGVDNAYKGRQFGLALMKSALTVAKTASLQVGSYGVYLDADAGAVNFYDKLGFKLLEGNKSPDPSPMFIPFSAIGPGTSGGAVPPGGGTPGNP